MLIGGVDLVVASLLMWFSVNTVLKTNPICARLLIR